MRQNLENKNSRGKNKDKPTKNVAEKDEQDKNTSEQTNTCR